jgi:hypothetical protein
VLEEPEPEEPELVDDEPDVELDVEPDDVSLDESEELELPDVLPGAVDADDPRLSVLKNPVPLKVMPTGWKTFLTGSSSPDSGCSSSRRLSSWKDCRTSTVSPVPMNL